MYFSLFHPHFFRMGLRVCRRCYRIARMIKFAMCDLPLLLDFDWLQALLDFDWFQAVLDIDLLQALFAVFPVVILITFAATLRSFNGKVVGRAVLFFRKTLLNEAGFHRPESPLWFALGP